MIARLKDWLRGRRRGGARRRCARPATPRRTRRRRRRCAPCSPCWSTKAASSPATPSPAPLAALDRDQRRAVTRLGIRIGALDLFMPAVLKPEAMRWRAALRAAAAGAADARAAAAIGRGPARAARTAALLARLGFRAAGPQMIRVDMAERIAATPMRPAPPSGASRSTPPWSPRSACSPTRWRS